jgi:hypothetical protein
LQAQAHAPPSGKFQDIDKTIHRAIRMIINRAIHKDSFGSFANHFDSYEFV